MHTDERLVALGIYIPIFENRRSTILTRDIGIMRLMEAAVDTLMRDDDSLVRNYCRKAFSEASPIIYIRDDTDNIFTVGYDASSSLGRVAVEETATK